MRKINVALKNAYGISALRHEFDFSNNNMPVAIYAPNGTMKTSFSKSFLKYSNGTQPEDLMFPDRESFIKLSDESQNPISAESIFVVESFNEKYESDKISSLIASDSLKREYDSIFESIGKKRNALFRSLKSLSGLSKGIEEEFCDAFNVRQEELVKALARLDREVKDGENEEYSDILYKTVFSPKAIEFFSKKDVRSLIQKYTSTYESIIDNSRYFKRGIFNHSNAETIAKNLKSNGWFDGGHSVNLRFGSEQKELLTETELVQAIDEEKDQILSDPELKNTFDKVERSISTGELRNLRDYLLDNPLILTELENFKLFKQKVWIGYLVKLKDDYLTLVQEYDDSKNKLNTILDNADREQTRWEDTVELFNQRFSVPFKVRIENKSDAMLARTAPRLVFDFEDQFTGQTKKTSSSELWGVLSTGERRALYILNILFEIEARIELGLETLFIFDDIADSFDYKNKYAIIEYLNDMRNDDLCRIILLTHNFDFYRTSKSRLGIFRNNKLLCSKEANLIRLIPDDLKGDESPLKRWKYNLNDPAILLAMIPFARNLAEYVGNDDAYRSLTSLLHIKPKTKEITLNDLQKIFERIFADNSISDFPTDEGTVFDLTIKTCSDLCEKNGDNLPLEAKIALSIGIRICLEEVLIKEINDDEYVNNIPKSQTSKLRDKYKKMSSSKPEILSLAQKVMLTTSENIHMNSFMYEPILDLSGVYLQELFQCVQSMKAEINNSPQSSHSHEA